MVCPMPLMQTVIYDGVVCSAVWLIKLSTCLQPSNLLVYGTDLRPRNVVLKLVILQWSAFDLLGSHSLVPTRVICCLVRSK